MRRFCRCGSTIPSGRFSLGYRDCSKCGEVKAQEEIRAKQLRVAPQGNKQGMAYMGDVAAARKNLLDATDQRRITANVPTTASNVRVTEQKQPFKRRKAVGVLYFGTQPNGEIIYDLNDARIDKASRKVFF